MLETLKVAALVFFAILIPVSLWNAASLYLAESCDPKFGCFGVFELLTLIVFICAIISAVAISMAYYIFMGRFGNKALPLNVALLLGCIAIGLIGNSVLYLGELLGASLLVFVWALVSFLFGVIVFKFNKKYNKA